MSIIQRDYLLPPKLVEIPLELAVLIARSATREAEQLEEKVIGQATREALAMMPSESSPTLLSKMIASRAVALADRAEERAVERLVIAAQRLLRRGVPVAEVVEQLGL